MPTLEEYAAQQAQNPQQAQEPQQAQPLDIVAARIDAEKLSLLMAEARQAITDYQNPATILTAITGAMFGEESPEAAAVAEKIEQDRNPGGYELTIANLRQQRKILQQQAKALESQLKTVAEGITTADAAEREIISKRGEAEAQNGAMVDLLTFFKGIDGRGTLLQEMKALYQKHRDNPAAMGLLYGSMTEIARREYTAGRLDLVQQQEYTDLKAQVLAAAEGQAQ